MLGKLVLITQFEQAVHHVVKDEGAPKHFPEG